MSLALERKPNQSILIGDDIRVTVVSIKGEKVRITVDAPRNVAVDRHEVRERKSNDNGVHVGPVS